MAYEILVLHKNPEGILDNQRPLDFNTRRRREGTLHFFLRIRVKDSRHYL